MKLTNEQLAQWRNLVERGVKPTKPGDDTFTYFRDELKLLDHIDELESELARERASSAALLEKAIAATDADVTGMIIHTLRSMALNLKDDYRKLMETAADAFEKHPRVPQSTTDKAGNRGQEGIAMTPEHQINLLLDRIDTLESELARERASAAALLEGLAKKWKAQCPGQPETFLDDYWRGFTVKGQACAEELLAAITTDQASLGGASPSDPKPAKGNPPATERSART